MYFQKGQTLIEVVAALGVAIVVISAMTVAVISALSTAQFSKNQNIATQYAQQGMELLRQKKNANFDFFKGSGTYCLAKGSTTMTPSGGITCGVNMDNTFVRQVTIEANSSDCNSGGAAGTKVVVSVSWTDNKCTFTPSPVPATDTPTPTTIPTPTASPTPTDTPTTTPIPYSPLSYCHEIKLTSCFSSYNVIPTL